MTRRLILNPVKKKELEVTYFPSLEQLVADATTIIANELAFYRGKTSRGVTLSAQESRIIRDYVQSLTALCKEAREQIRMQDLSSLSDEELLILAQQLVLKSDKHEKGENDGT